MDARTRLEDILGERIAVLDGSWGVLIQREVKGEEAYRGDRFKDHPRDVAGRPGPPQPHPARDRPRHPPRLLRGRRRHRDDEHVHRHDDRPGRLWPRGSRPYEMNVEGARLARQAADEVERFRCRFGRAAQRHALAFAARRRPCVPNSHLRPGARGLCGSDPRSRRGRRRLPAHRDDLRHAQREGGDRCGDRRSARTCRSGSPSRRSTAAAATSPGRLSTPSGCPSSTRTRSSSA